MEHKNYNDGMVHVDFYDQKDKFSEMADSFSEGDPLLRDCLLDMWENGIKTEACCKGHDDSYAYISIIIDDNSQALIDATGDYLNLQNGQMQLCFQSTVTKDYDSFIVRLCKESDKIEYLRFIQNFLSQKQMDYECNNHISEYADCLLKFSRRFFVECSFYVEVDEMCFGFCRPGSILYFGENILPLSDFIDKIKETGDIPLIPLSCDEKSLKEFVSFLYPEKYIDNGGIKR